MNASEALQDLMSQVAVSSLTSALITEGSNVKCVMALNGLVAKLQVELNKWHLEVNPITVLCVQKDILALQSHLEGEVR